MSELLIEQLRQEHANYTLARDIALQLAQIDAVVTFPGILFVLLTEHPGLACAFPTSWLICMFLAVKWDQRVAILEIEIDDHQETSNHLILANETAHAPSSTAAE